MNNTSTNTSTSTSADLSRRDPRAAEKIQQRATVAPSVDIYENKDELLLIADLPGVSRDGVRINLDKMELTLEGKRQDAWTEGEALTAEGSTPDFRRSFLLPQGLDTDKIAAELANGVLRVHLPKSAAQKPRQIQVKVS